MTFRALSLGGGQVSTALAIAIVERRVVNGYDFGALSPLDKITFADTRANSGPEFLGELEATYAHLKTFGEYLAAHGHLLDVVRATGPGLMQRVLGRIGGYFRSAPAMPFYLADTGQAAQHCTRDFKGRPIDRSVKIAARNRGKLHDVEVLIGYSIDEWSRCRSGTPDEWPDGWRWRYPLVEARVGRGWCIETCREALGYVPVSSACAFCPHRPDVGPGSRAEIRASEPATWAKVVAFDAAIRGGVRRSEEEVLHLGDAPAGRGRDRRGVGARRTVRAADWPVR